MKYSYPHGPKSDWMRQAESIQRGDIVTTKEDIPMLFIWLQDMNWPGAEIISSHLKSFGDANLECIRKVLRSGDDIWIMWVLIEFGDAFGRTFWADLVVELKSVAFGADKEGANIQALYILAKERLVPIRLIKSKLTELRAKEESDPEDFKKVEAIVDAMEDASAAEE